MDNKKGSVGILTVVGSTVRIVTRITCVSRTGGAGLDTGIGSDFLGMRTGLALTASRSGVFTSPPQ